MTHRKYRSRECGNFGSARLWLFACIALFFAACKQSQDVPPQSPPTPQTSAKANAQTGAKSMAQSGIKKAVFSYSVRPGEPCQVDRSVGAGQRAPET
ncbi:MAG TPA: hypothetical protein VHK70_05015 [Burkholderiaceae bacterium]|nr:hypothetical protein [Burkholderiaceae bacterium]